MNINEDGDKNLRDASFSYLRSEGQSSLSQKGSSSLEMMRKKKNDHHAEGEISVFGAERYFNMALDHHHQYDHDHQINIPRSMDRRSSSSLSGSKNISNNIINIQNKKEINYLQKVDYDDDVDHNLMIKTYNRPPGTPSACSEVSWNSRSTALLLPTNNHNNISLIKNPSRNINNNNNNNNVIICNNSNIKKKKKIMVSGKNIILATFGCSGSCFGGKSVYVDSTSRDADQHNQVEVVQAEAEEVADEEKSRVITRSLERSSKRSEEHFAFPILSSTDQEDNQNIITTADQETQLVNHDHQGGEDQPRMSLEVFGSKTTTKRADDRRNRRDDVAINLERKLSVLTWDAIPAKPGGQMMMINNNSNNNKLISSKKSTAAAVTDIDSDASSDLFEIENLNSSTAVATGTISELLVASRQVGLSSNDKMSRRTTPNYTNNDNEEDYGYEPSEASVEWSVVTASAAAAADIASSAASDYDENKLAAANHSHYYNYKNINKTTSSSISKGGVLMVDNKNKERRSGNRNNTSGNGIMGCKSHKAVRVAESTSSTTAHTRTSTIIR